MNTNNSSVSQEIIDDMSTLQKELEEALQEILRVAGNKLSKEERLKIEKEISDTKTLLERLKSGYVWIALFGKTSVGKSAIANSLMCSDIAEVGIQHDLTRVPIPYYKNPWAIVDVPGILGSEINEDIAIQEARRAHGHIFVIDGEPYGPEIKLFDLVCKEFPDSPRIVFVNKWDVAKLTTTEDDRAVIQSAIKEKMGKYVSSSTDIVYGNALTKDIVNDLMIRQELPDLLDRMYENAGTLGQVINVLDPAKRSESINSSIRDKILEIRIRTCRTIINVSSLSSAFTGAAPFGELTVMPALWVGMVSSIFVVMGVRKAPTDAAKLVKEIAVACAQTLGAWFVALAGATAIVDFATTIATPFAGIGAALGFAADFIALGIFKFRRTAVLGEAAIEYIRNDFSWGVDGAENVIKKCRERAETQYDYIKQRGKAQ